ncbi:hypothetical protein QIS99_27580 [Streptomyces sp. B-S-A8]|uniref:Uncharacterized protein n=1 Tax=Streptomyces solicavernae TaxID=3043614 RepID=A0ABT6RZR7_9ACTN|nr:hypothetical protein [Streptomyces sp. B-S-A8]MDI3389924.1 hypothetical protein [Streptomyces sp. B-S-A8]
MPRPTAAQLVYGSATVVLATLAMLLLSRTRSGIGVAVIAVAALALGLLVAVTVPMPGAAPRMRAPGRAGRAGRAALPSDAAPVAVRPVRGGAESRATEHSLHT